VFHVVLPLADVLVPIRQHHCAIAVLLSLLEVAFVHAAIFVGQSALTLEQVVGEKSVICALGLGEVVNTLASEYAIDEVTFVEAAVGPLVATAPILLALVVGALESNACLVPGLATLAMLLVIQPFAIVGRALAVDESATTISHSVHPLALVDAAISLAHAPEALHLVIDELALVLRAVWPDQDAQAVLHLALVDVPPLALVLLGNLLGVGRVGEGTVDVTFRLIAVNVMQLSFTEKGRPTLHTLRRWHLYVG